MTDTAPPRIGFVSLGCPKNLVDSERILTQLRAEGYEIVARYEIADLVIVNTCGFIDTAVDESLDAIGEALVANGRVLVTGCLGAACAEEILARHPQVLGITGAHAYEAVMEQVHAHLPAPHDPFLDLFLPQGVKLTPCHYAYLKISEGCNQRCTFCIIPRMRGRLVSRPIGEVLVEAERLVESGVRELLIVSQDTGAYGVDVRYRADIHGGRVLETRITTLVRELGQLPVWVRLHYVYPYPHVDNLIPLMAEGHVLPYLDIPLQHASERILRAMKRPAASEQMLDRIRRWREICPELVLRSTFIVGFPGETEEDFDRLLDFLQEARLDRVGAFAYSPVEGAAANTLPGAVPEEVRQDRLTRFMDVQAQISRDRLAGWIGRCTTVLVDAVEDARIVARGPGDAPEIDGQVFIEGAWEGVDAGDFIEVEITGYDEHDLYAEPV